MTGKYSIAVQGAQIGKNGLAERAGWLTVYHADPLTREYTGASYEYLMIGTGIPADSYADAPDLPAPGQALRRTADGSVWEHVPDYRGQTVYRTDDGHTQVVKDIGALPDSVTLLPPSTEFDLWNGEQWVTNVAAQRAAAVAAAQQEQAARKATATARITELGYAVELGIATDAEQTALTAWKTYLVKVGRIDTGTAPDINWPEVPSE